MILTISNYYFPEHHYLIGRCNGDRGYFLYFLIYCLDELQDSKRPQSYQTHPSQYPSSFMPGTVANMRDETVQTDEQIHPHNFCSAAIQFYVILLFLEAFNQELICTRTEYGLSTKFSGGLASGLDECTRSTGSPHQAVINQLSSSVCCHLFTSKFLYME